MADLDPVTATFKAEIGDFMEKVAEIKAALDSLRDKTVRVDVREDGRALDDARRGMDDFDNSAKQVTRDLRDTESGVQRTDQALADLGRRLSNGGDEVSRKWRAAELATQRAGVAAAQEARAATQGIDAQLKARQRLINALDEERSRIDSLRKSLLAESGAGGGGGFINAWRGFANKGSGWTNVGNMALMGAAGGPLVAGAAWPIVGTLVGAAPGLAATAAMFPFLKDAMGEVTKAFSTLETQQNSYNVAAAQTASWLKSGGNATKQYNTLLSALDPSERSVVGLLAQQGVQWDNLTGAQQRGLVALRNDNTAYKDLSQSQKNALNALLAEQKAWNTLEPAQQQALHNYTAMHNVYDQLRSDAMPSMFQTIATFESAATHAMQPMLPLIQAAAAGWNDLGHKLDAAFQSQGYHNFVNLLAGHARQSINDWGTAVGNLAVGFGKLFETAIQSGFGDRFDAWLVSVTGHFDNWAHSQAGVDWVNRFLARLEANGPTTMKILGQVIDTLGRLIGILSANRGTLQIIELISQWLLDLMKVPGVGFVVRMAVYGTAIIKLADSISKLSLVSKGLPLVGKLLQAVGGTGIVGRFGGVLAGGAAAGGEAAAGGAAAGAAEAGGATALGAAGAGIGAAALPILGGAALLALPIAIGLFAKHFHDQSLAAAGVVEHQGQAPTVALNKTTQQEGQAFRDWVSNWSKNSQVVGTTITTQSGKFRDATTQFAANYTHQIDQIKAAVQLGTTQFGQATSEFVLTTGGNLKALSASVKGDANTLFNGMAQDFSSGAQMATKTTLGGIASWKAETNTSLQDYANGVIGQTKSDYNNLSSTVKQLEADTAAGRTAAAQQDTQKVMAAVAQFESDYANGRIVTTQGQMAKVSADLQAYYKDKSNGDDQAMQADINQLMNDVQGKWKSSSAATNQALVMADQAMWNSLNTNWKSQSAAAESQAEGELNSVMQNAQAWGQQHGIKVATGIGGSGGITVATGGYISGPGTGTSDSIPARLSNGEYVINARATAQHRELLDHINAKGFANGGPVFSVNALADDVGVLATIKTNAYHTAYRIGIMELIQQALMAQLGGTIPTGMRLQIIDAALTADGIPQGVWPMWEAGLNTLITRESGWNAGAVNRTDSNAAAGTPSEGLAQVIQPTFNAYRNPSLPDVLTNPVANVAAAINYINAVYGGIQNVQQANANLPPKGYDSGGILGPGWTTAYNGTGQPEAVLTNQQFAAVAGSRMVTVPVVVQVGEQELLRTVQTVTARAERRTGTNVLEPA